MIYRKEANIQLEPRAKDLLFNDMKTTRYPWQKQKKQIVKEYLPASNTLELFFENREKESLLYYQYLKYT